MGWIGACLCTEPELACSELNGESEATVGGALERLGRIARLGLRERGRIAGLGGLGTCGQRQVSEIRAWRLSLPKNKSGLMRRKSEKRVPVGRPRRSTRGRSH